MKKVLTCLTAFTLAMLIALPAQAQFKTPAPSPHSKTEQTIGLTDFTVEYSRPGVKGRKIFAVDGLVPFGKIWRTGANKNTILTFSDDVTIAGQKVKAGAYALFTKPAADEWTIILYDDTNNWGLPEKWNEEKEAARFTVKPEEIPMDVETFTIAFNDIKSNTASLNLMWENTLVSIPLEVEVDAVVMKEFEKLMAGPTASDYYRMASYLHENGGDLDKALKYVNIAAEGDPKFWVVRRKSEILADMGRYDDAIEAAKHSLKLAQEAGSQDYVALNEKNIAMWNKKKMKKQ